MTDAVRIAAGEAGGVLVQVSARTDRGKLRQHNEDALTIGERLWAVADGMGGQAAGEVASSVVSQQLQMAGAKGIHDAQTLSTVLARINEQILDYGHAHPVAVGLGSTVAGLALIEVGGLPHWMVFNIGDSRVYRFTDDGLSLITRDHSEVGELLAQGKVTAEQARKHPNRNILTRCLGSSPAPRADIRILPTALPEQFVICSDGLSTEVTDAEIGQVLMTTTGPDDTVDRLLALALERGGRDNISVIAVAGSDVHHEVVTCKMTENTVPQTHERRGGSSPWLASSVTLADLPH